MDIGGIPNTGGHSAGNHETDNRGIADIARPDGKTGRSYQQQLHEERKARLARLKAGAFVAPKPFAPEPFVMPAPPPPKLPKVSVRIKSADRYWPNMWFWDLVIMSPKPELSGRPTFKRILQEVSDYYAVPVTELLSARRSKAVSHPRQVAMYLAKTLTLMTLPQIGQKLSGRDHSTVLHGVRKIARGVSISRELRSEVDAIKAEIFSL